MTFHKMRTRLAAFGLALAMGLIPMGNVFPAYATEEPASQQENVISENTEEENETIQAQHRVVAEDLTLKVNDKTFSIGTSLEGIQYDPEQDAVSFYKVVGDDGSEYQPYKAGTYTASYLVTPKDQQECYVVTRKIILTDTEGMASGSDNGGDKQKTDMDPEDEPESDTDVGEKEDSELNPDSEPKKEPESDPDSESKKNAEFDQDSESKKEQSSEKDAVAGEKTESKPQGTAKVKITASGKEDTEESLSKLQKDLTDGKIMIVSATGSDFESTNPVVNLEKGDTVQYPDPLGDSETCLFQVNGRAAYCLENQKPAAFSADTVSAILDSNENLQKVLYYGYGGKGDLTGEALSGKSEEEKYVYTHIAANYAYIGDAGFMGCTREDLEKAGVMDYIDFLFGQENPPSNRLSLSAASVDAVQDGDLQKTPEIRLDGDSRNYIEISVPEEITCYNVTKEESATNGTIKIYGGDSFYLSAEMDVDGQYDSGELFCSIKDGWKLFALASGEGKEEIGVYESPSAEPVRFTVDWLEQAKLSLLKKDQDTDAPVAGAVYGIYKDSQCKELLMELQETGENGKTASGYFDTEWKQVFVKERKAPEKYLLDSKVYPIDVENQKEIGLTVYDVPENTEQENKPTEIHAIKIDAVTGETLEGAVLQLADEKGNLIEEWTTTKETHVIYGLPEGEYILHEKMAPYQEGYVSASNLTFQVSEESVTEVEMKDEYSKIDISVQDQPTGKALPGVTLQIVDQDGNVLKEWVTDGKPYRVEKLPVNEELTLRETNVPKGYVISKEAKFIVTDTEEIQGIEIKNARVSDPASASGNTSVSGNTSAPKTGDALHLLVVFVFAGLLSFLVLAVLLIRRRKRYGREEE
nr:thioester domain-containing protein [uncultured Schaedlerella sp.]